MVDSEYSRDNRKTSKIHKKYKKSGIGTVIKNPKMLRLIPDHHKTNEMCNNAVVVRN